MVTGCEVSSWLEIMSKTLTDEQAEILRFASGGHNILITGQAGAGKSTVVNSIRQDCRERGLKVAIVCPVPLDGWGRLCHDGAVAKLEIQILCPR